MARVSTEAIAERRDHARGSPGFPARSALLPLPRRRRRARERGPGGEGVGALRFALVVLLALLAAGCGEQPPATPPRPTVIVVTASGPYYTSFDEAGDWLVGGGGKSSGAVLDGAYRLAINEPATLAWTHQPRAFGEGVYEVDARLASGPEASAFGLLLQGSSDLQSFFYVMITGDGRYDIGYCERGCQVQESLIGGFTLGHSILADYQTNRIRVELRGGVLTLSVNGTPLGQVEGLETGEGLVGLIGESAAYGGFEALFDNLQVVED